MCFVRKEKEVREGTLNIFNVPFFVRKEKLMEKVLSGGFISDDNDFLVIGSHKFFCDDLLDSAMNKIFLPKTSELNPYDEVVKPVNAIVVDQNGKKFNVKFRCAYQNDGERIVSTHVWISE